METGFPCLNPFTIAKLYFLSTNLHSVKQLLKHKLFEQYSYTAFPHQQHIRIVYFHFIKSHIIYLIDIGFALFFNHCNDISIHFFSVVLTYQNNLNQIKSN